MGGPGSAFSTSSSSATHSSNFPRDQSTPPHGGITLEDPASSWETQAGVGSEGGGGIRAQTSCARGAGGGGAVPSQEAQSHHQMSPSERPPALSIPPPPQDLLDDSHMSFQDGHLLDSEQSSTIWAEDSASNFSLLSSSSYNDNTEVPRKSRKRTPRQRPGPKLVPAEEASVDMFDADSAKGPHFVLSQLGPDSKPCPTGSPTDGAQAALRRGGTLWAQYPQSSEGLELKILAQPESQHRARYLTEGSRGSVKDRSQLGFPTVKLEGHNEPAVLQVFVGNDSGRVKPHGFYQACKVTGRNSTACKEVDVEGTTVIEVSLDPSCDMTAAVDCVGILKLRNADVEARMGLAGSKKKSTRARLVFRVDVRRADGSVLTLQAPSCSILCTQPAGLPEILRKSMHSCSAAGGKEMFIIGKNFLRDTKVVFQENMSDDGSWKAEAEIDAELFHQNHLVVTVPPYRDLAIRCAAPVGIYVRTAAGRSHDVHPFTYCPDPAILDAPVKEECHSSGMPCSRNEHRQVKREEVTPMEVTSNLQSAVIFKTSDVQHSAQQARDRSSNHLTNSGLLSNNLPQHTSDPEKIQAASFTDKEPLGAIKKQDIAPTSSFSAPCDPLLKGSQQFLLESREALVQDRPETQTRPEGRLCVKLSSEHHLAVFPTDEVAQLEKAVRQLEAKGFSRLPLQAENALTKQLHCRPHIQQPLQIQKQHIQQPLQIQKQHIQQQQKQIHQQLQHQRVLEKLQQQLFQPQTPMQCNIFPGNCHASAEQRGPAQGMMPNHGPLFQKGQQKQDQQGNLFQQSTELLSSQISFLQHTPSHISPPLFHDSGSLAEAQDPQGVLFPVQESSCSPEQVQTVLFRSTLKALSGTNLSPEQQPPAPGLFLSPGPTGTSQQRLAFFGALQPCAPKPPAVFPAQSQLTSVQQGPLMEQQQCSQTPTQIQPPQNKPLFANIAPHQPANALSPSQQQQQQASLQFCNNVLPSQDQASSLMFRAQAQMPPCTNSLSSPEPKNTLLFTKASMVPVSRQEPSEPMLVGNAMQPHQQVVFLQQQPMQLEHSSSSQPEQPIPLFITQPPMATLQGGMAAKDLLQPPVFALQDGLDRLQSTPSAAVQQPGSQFQTVVSGTRNQSSQPQQFGLFLFGTQNECEQLRTNPEVTLADQIIAISQSGQNQESDAHIQSLLNQPLSDSGTEENRLTASQNMEKIDDLLVCLQEQGSSLAHTYQNHSAR